MAQLKSKEVERSALTMAAALMAASARTSPKGRAVDSTTSLVLTDEDMEKLAQAMERKAAEKPDYLATVHRRDANNVRNSGCVLLLGVTGEPKKIQQPIDCGACGFANCEQLDKARKKTKGKDFNGPVCIFQAMDLGIALCSAVKLAADLGIDNRMMYTIGVAAQSLGLLDSDIIIGIPLSVTGKNPYFDRG
jgi:uncharacterized ferredoxin-like protein